MKKKMIFILLFFISFFVYNTRVEAFTSCYYSSPFLGIYKPADLKSVNDLAGVDISFISNNFKGNYVFDGSHYCSKSFCMQDARILSDQINIWDSTNGTIRMIGEAPNGSGDAYLYLFVDVYNDYKSQEHSYSISDDNINNWHLEYASEDSMHSYGLFQTKNETDFNSENILNESDNFSTPENGKLLKGTKCPRYIIIEPNEPKPTYQMQVSLGGIGERGKVLSSFLPGYKGSMTTNDSSEMYSFYYIGKYYFYKVYDNSVEDMITGMSLMPNTKVLALSDFNISKEDEKTQKEAHDYNKKIVIENLTEILNITINKWAEVINYYEEKLKTGCASSPHEWYDYINLKNYSDKNRDTFSKYANREWPDYKKDTNIPDYDTSRKYDVEMTKECWDARRGLVNLFYKGATYSLLSLFDRNGDAKDYKSASKKGTQYIIPIATEDYKMKFSDTMAGKYKKLNWYYFALVYGVDTIFEEFETTNKTIEDLDDKYKENEEACGVKEILEKDQCAYMCKNPKTGKLETKYYEENCKTNKDENYKKCKEAYDACKCADCEDSGKNSTEDAKIKCRDNCRKCVEDKKGTYKYSDWLSKYNDSVKLCDETTEKVKEQIEENKKTYDFQFVDEPLGVRWNTLSYEGNCKDVEFLHYIWNIIIIGAPFMVIILGMIDYFKNVINVDQNASNKNKKNFARRLIALILLLLVPFIIKLIVSNLTPEGNSASNIKLMQCIVNGE